jgi:hypothetical protein
LLDQLNQLETSPGGYTEVLNAVKSGDFARAQDLLNNHQKSLDLQLANASIAMADKAMSRQDYPQAKDLYRGALGLQEKWLGADHADTISTRKKLADVDRHEKSSP